MRTLILSFCVAVFCLQLEQSAAAKICGANGYDVATLSQGDYWMVTEAKQQRKCFRLNGTEVEDISYCEFYYSFCHALPDDICPSIIRTADIKPSVCQKVFYTNGSSIEYDMGKFSTEHEYHPTNTTSFDGFETSWTGEKVTTAECSGSTKMLMSFKCDQALEWEPGNPNITKYLDTLFRLDCAYIVQVNYEGACYQTPTIAPGNCQLSNYDIATLSDRLYWTATIPDSSCIGGGAGATCTIAFSFCHSLPPNITETCNGASVCQLATTAGVSTSYSMGMFENYTQFRQNDDENNPGFHVQWDNGSFTQDCMTGLTTEIIFLCKETSEAKDWTAQNQTANLAHASYDNPCGYILEFDYYGACSSESHHHTKTKTSPIGWIFIGLFFGAVLIYLAVGTAFQYFVKGERGIRVLPNYDFWKAFVVYVLEGCRFFLDLVTCFRFEGKAISTAKVDYDKI